MNDTVHIFRTITLRPHWFQYVINEFVALCFFLAASGYGNFAVSNTTSWQNTLA